MNIGQRIRALRESINMTQEELAQFIKSTKQTIFKYEAGIITNIPMDKLATIANALGTTPAYLMGWEEVMEDKRMDGGHRELVALIEQLTDEEVAELSNFVDYIISKRK